MGVETAIIASIAGAAFSSYSAYNQAKQSKAAYNYQAAVNRNNAMVAEWSAQDAARVGEQNLINQRQRTAALLSNQRATFAGRGIDLSEGSALNVLSDTVYLGEQDARTVQDNTAKDVWQNKVQGSNYEAAAGLQEMQADNQSPWLAAGTSLLGSSGQVSQSWYRYKGK